MKAWMNFSQRFKKISIAGDGKRNTPAAHDGPIEGHEHGEGHSGRHQQSAQMADGNLRGCWSRYGRRCYCLGRHHKLYGSIYADIKHSHNRHPGYQRYGNASLWIANLTADHVEVIPAVISPERRDQRGHKTSHSAFGSEKCSAKVTPVSRCRAEACSNDHGDHHNFERGHHELEVSGFAYAQIIQSGDQYRCANRDQMAVSELIAILQRKYRMRKKTKR